MPTTDHRIDGSLLVLNPDKKGASIVVPKVDGRPRFQTIRARRDQVSLIDSDGNGHVLDDANPFDAEVAASLGAMLVREMSTEDQDDFLEYAIGTDIDLSIDAEVDAGGMSP